MQAAADNATVEIPAPASHWTPEQQIAHMLDLCEAQIEAALSESDMAVETLIKSFTALTEATRTLEAMAAKALPEHPDETHARLSEQTAVVARQTAAAIVAFQFYDKLTQRLGHVRYSLSTLALFVCDRSQASERDQWRKLFTTLRRLYRTEEERQIFQLMVEGVSADEARAQAQQTTQKLRRPGEVELF
jgi:ribosomal protein L16 Arg81 hydroxylase